MAAINWADVVSIAPELESVPVGARADLLAVANGRWKAADTGSSAARVRLARMFYAAHLASQAAQGGEGTIKSDSVGGVSVTYADGAVAVADYQSSYREIIRALPHYRGARVV